MLPFSQSLVRERVPPPQLALRQKLVFIVNRLVFEHERSSPGSKRFIFTVANAAVKSPNGVNPQGFDACV